MFIELFVLFDNKLVYASCVIFSPWNISLSIIKRWRWTRSAFPIVNVYIRGPDRMKSCATDCLVVKLDYRLVRANRSLFKIYFASFKLHRNMYAPLVVLLKIVFWVVTLIKFPSICRHLVRLEYWSYYAKINFRPYYFVVNVNLLDITRT